MNYIIENNIDFYSELNKELIDSCNVEELCLLTHIPLESNNIQLECGHKFNYLPLYHEVCKQKSQNYFETTQLLLNQIKCPYCRKITNNILPYIEHPDVERKKGVNVPSKYSMYQYNCQWIKNTKNMGKVVCNKGAVKSEYGILCCQHINILKNKEQDIKNKETLDSLWTSEHDKINKKYNIIQLKEIIKTNSNKYKLKVSGTKKALVDRVIYYGLIDNNINNTDINNTNLNNSDSISENNYQI